MQKCKETKVKLLTLILIVTALFITLTNRPESAWTFSGCESKCMNCHKLTPEEAEAILKEEDLPAPLGVRVISVNEFQTKGLWEVVVLINGKKGIVYIDFSKRFLVAGPIIELKTFKNLTQERLIDLNRVDVSKIPLEDSLVMGNESTKYKIIVFSDPDCPFCARLHNELKKVLEQRPDIAFYIKLFPLPIHKDAYWKAKSIQCSKSLELLEENFKGKVPPKVSCETEVIDRNIALAQEIGINGTPTMILPDGRMVSGAISAERIIEMVTNQ